MRRALAAAAVFAALAALWLAADAWRAGRIPRSGRPMAAAPAEAPAPAAEPPAADSAPSRASASLTIAWEDPDGRSYRSEIALQPDAAAPESATVVTRDHASGQELVRYRARARRDTAGVLTIDGDGAPVSGPMAAEWSPDSFTIAADGRVGTRDAQGNPGIGWVMQEDGFRPPPP
jgi:hypothetical protein